MQRMWILMSVLAALGLLAACDGGAKQAPATFERVNAVTVQPKPAEAAPPAVPVGWCDGEFKPDDPKAPVFALPKLEAAGGALPAFPNDRWVWVNLWATWCKPCVKELPVLGRWLQNLASQNVPFDLWALSVDDNAKDLADFLKANPNLVPGHVARFAKADDLTPFLKTYNLAEGASVPVQVLVAPGGKVRCVRAGGISDADYNTLRALMGR